MNSFKTLWLKLITSQLLNHNRFCEYNNKANTERMRRIKSQFSFPLVEENCLFMIHLGEQWKEWEVICFLANNFFRKNHLHFSLQNRVDFFNRSVKLSAFDTSGNVIKMIAKHRKRRKYISKTTFWVLWFLTENWLPNHQTRKTQCFE